MQSLFSLEEASELIRSGKAYTIAGEEELLASLPQGKWLGGTIPYFMSEEGGLCSRDRLMVIPLPEMATDVSIRMYTTMELTAIPKNYPENGFSRIILPAFSETHRVFAEECSSWPGIFDRPLVGWVAGVELGQIGKITPKVFNGETGECSDECAVVVSISLPPGYVAKANILNLFKQGDGDVIQFPRDGFTATDCLVNGEKKNFAAYATEKKLDTRLPLVADYTGAMINVSIQSIDTEKGQTAFYAPVFPGVEYKLAAPVGDYAAEFEKELAGQNVEPLLACNCILNYLYANLEGKRTGEIVGPMTFGEIAYMLLNQTLVYMTIEKE